MLDCNETCEAIKQEKKQKIEEEKRKKLEEEAAKKLQESAQQIPQVRLLFILIIQGNIRQEKEAKAEGISRRYATFVAF